MKPQSVGYAPTPPADRPHLVRQGDDFTLTLPPRVGWRTAMYLAILAPVAALLLAGAVWPPSVTRVGSVTIETIPWMHLGRLLFALLGFVVAGIALGTTRRCRTWTTIEVHGEMLLCTAPGAFKTAVTKRHELAALREARVVEEDGTTRLELEPRTGGQAKTLLLDSMGALHRRSDLEFAAAVIGEAIDSRAPAPAAR